MILSPKISWAWEMPNRETFKVKCILNFVKNYWNPSHISIDVFARDCEIATYTNDLNPNTRAKYHLEARTFLELMKKKGIVADIIIFDPPYSLTRMKRTYQGIGFNTIGKVRSQGWSLEQNLIADLVKLGGYVLSFGWNSTGMGAKRLFTKEEILLVGHGASHNDTICVAERKVGEQGLLF